MLADGSYTFQVQALGTAGVSGTAGPAASATFLVDTTPPVISNLRFALTGGAASVPAQSPGPDPAPAPGGGADVVLPSGAFTAAFDVTDGVLGSGVNGCAPSHLRASPTRPSMPRCDTNLTTLPPTTLLSLPAQLLRRAAAVTISLCEAPGTRSLRSRA